MNIKTNIKKKLIICLMLFIAFAIICALHVENSKSTSVKTIDASISCKDGSYIIAQIIIPENYKEEKLPLVTLGHGFRGSMNSAGGEHLAKSLAEEGIATIRMDYSHSYDEEGKERTCSYTVDTMAEDQLICIKYMEENFNIDRDRIGIYGRSLGGRVAMKMANESLGGYDYKALALIAPAGNSSALTYYMHGEDKWESMKEEAREKGYVIHQKVKLTPEFFSSVDDYIPSEEAYKYKNPVFVCYNALDNVVLPETSRECALAYEDHIILEVVSEDGHGYEMSYEESKLKDRITYNIVSFFTENLKNRSRG